MRYRTAVILIAVTVLGLTVTALAFTGDGDAPAIDETSTHQGGFVGLTLEDAIAGAEDDDRPWRVSRQDDEELVLTADLWPGRVTFEVDDGVVTSADIEEPFTPPDDYGLEDASERAGLLADALTRLLLVDNGFGSADVFDDIRVSRSVGSDSASPLFDLDLEFIEAALSELGSVSFIDDVSAEIDSLFDATPAGVVVAVIERVELLDDRAEIELRLWCGSLCGVFLTYEAVPADSGWEITGVAGPIAMS